MGNCAGKTPINVENITIPSKCFSACCEGKVIITNTTDATAIYWVMGRGVGDRADSQDGERHVENLLHELYYDPQRPSAYMNVYRAARKVLPNIRRDVVERWFQ